MSRAKISTLLACALCLGACEFHYQPLEVRWFVDGATNPAVCKALGIKSWIVELIDTDLHAWTEVRCQDQSWTSGEAFYALEAEEDTFASPVLMVDAVDDTLSVKATQQRTVSMEVNRGTLIWISDVDFRSEDFGKP